MANELTYHPVNLFLQDGGGEYFTIMKIGNDGDDAHHGACRFTGVTVSQGATVSYALLSVYVTYKGSGTGGNLKIKTYGIDEDNTATFSSNPRGRDKTTASTSISEGMASVGQYQNINVQSQVNEIVGRGGWSSGNAMGFLLDDDGSTNGYWIDDESYLSRLIIRVAAEPDFTVTSSTIQAPTFPSPTKYGMKIAQPGKDVRTATEQQLYFFSRKKEFRVNQQKKIIAAAPFTYAHNLSYVPSVLGYTISSGKSYLMNSTLGPFDTGIAIVSDSYNVYMNIDSGEIVYYYTFIDPLT